MSQDLSCDAMVDEVLRELLDVVYKYNEAIYVATAIGALEIVKQLILSDALGGAQDYRKILLF